MSRLHLHPESHPVSRIGWLRAAVQGAHDCGTVTSAMPFASVVLVPPGAMVIGVAIALPHRLRVPHV